MTARVDILLSTYNGARHLPEQLRSLRAQTLVDWRLLVRDDGSSDETAQIIEQFAGEDPRISRVAEPAGNLGVVRSYATLLQRSSAPLFAFCDQDDVWLPHKLATLAARLEACAGGRPALAFSDLTLVDDALRERHPSFMAYQHFGGREAADWPHNLMQNTVVGCATMGNRALASLALERTPDGWPGVVMHDWWLALIASRFGEIMFEPASTVLYRQHADNELGAKGGGPRRYLRAVLKEQPLAKVANYLDRISSQAATFLAAFESRLDPADRHLLESLAHLRTVHGPARTAAVAACYRKGLRMQSGGRNWLVLLGSAFG